MSVDVYSFQQAASVFLFDHEKKRIRKEIDLLIREHDRIAPEKRNGFIYNGQLYRLTDADTIYPQLYGIEAPLIPSMDKILDEIKKLKRDEHRTKQLLLVLLTGCSTAQDVYDALPNNLHPAFESLKGLSRQREEAWSIEDNPRALGQYKKIKELVDFYSTTRLIY